MAKKKNNKRIIAFKCFWKFEKNFTVLVASVVDDFCLFGTFFSSTLGPFVFVVAGFAIEGSSE